MDKLFNNQWFLRFISLGIAVMLYAMVNMNNVSTQPGALPGTDESTYTINDVEIHAYYDEEKYEVVNIESSVDVKLTGPQSSIMLFQLSRPSYEVYVDLEGLGAGEHNVQIQHRDFPADLKVSLTPRFTSVTIEELKTESYPVEAELQNEEEAPEGYTFGGAKIEPSEVEVTAAPSMHERIDTIKAMVDIAGADSRVTTRSDIKAYDADGNELDVTIEPDIVDVEVPVTEPFKQVSVNLLREGNLPDGLSVESLNMEPSEVTIFGPLEVIEGIHTIETTLDLSEIEENTTIELELEVPEGVQKVQPNKVTVEVEVGEENDTVLKDIPIRIVNMPEEYSYSITNPEEQIADVVVSGSKEVINNVTAEDVSLIADWKEQEGEQEGTSLENSAVLPVAPSGPPNINVKTEVETVEVEWSEEVVSDNTEVEEETSTDEITEENTQETQ